MHQIPFRRGLRPRPHYGELTALPQTPQMDLRGLLLREGRGRRGKFRGRKRREREGRK